MSKTEVIIIGAGPAGVATSACLNEQGVSNVVLEREGCSFSLWKQKSYDRLKLHLAKRYCELPNMPFPAKAPTYVPKREFVDYLDRYATRYGVSPKYHRSVELAYFDGNAGKWTVAVKDTVSGVFEVFFAKFLVVATGENSRGFVPPVSGLEGFKGQVMHSSEYRTGESLAGKNVLVVGCGNSGMEIAYDLCNHNSDTSIVARGPVHVLSLNIVNVAMFLLRFLPVKLTDAVAVFLGRLKHGDVTKYGFRKPKEGPFYLKATTGKSATIDVGTMSKIKSGEIKVLPSISNIEGNDVKFENGDVRHFDAIVFATGYRSTVRNWLKGGEDLFDEKGMPRQKLPHEYWKGKDGIYCAGFSSRGLLGISQDAQNIANDIVLKLTHRSDHSKKAK